MRFLEVLTIGWLLVLTGFVTESIITATILGTDHVTFWYNRFGEQWIEVVLFPVWFLMGLILFIQKIRQLGKA